MLSNRSTAVTSPAQLGALVRKKRKSQHLTQGQVAEFCGVSVKFISEMERGKTTAEIGKILNLLNNLGIDLYADSRD